MDRIGVNGDLSHHLADRRQLVSTSEATLIDGAKDLFDDLPVRRDTTTQVEPEMNGSTGVHNVLVY